MAQEINRKIAKKYYDKFSRFCQPLIDNYGIKQLIYAKINESGHYTYMSINPEWDEFYFSNISHLKHNPIYRHPKLCQTGVTSLRMKEKNDQVDQVLNFSINNFNIHFSFKTVVKVCDGVEAFTFGLNSANLFQHKLLLNELPLLKFFSKRFHEEFDLSDSAIQNNLIDLAAIRGSAFYERATPIIPESLKKKEILSKLGMNIPANFTRRELEIIMRLTKSLTAQNIGKDLFIAKRTVEHHLENIKQKLHCNSKVELIQMIRDLEAVGGLP